MTQSTQARNPFMLMISPEVVFAAMESSERLSRLNRHLCRPLDRQIVPGVVEVPEGVCNDEAVVGCED